MDKAGDGLYEDQMELRMVRARTKLCAILLPSTREGTQEAQAPVIEHDEKRIFLGELPPLVKARGISTSIGLE